MHIGGMPDHMSLYYDCSKPGILCGINMHIGGMPDLLMPLYYDCSKLALASAGVCALGFKCPCHDEYAEF